VLKSDDEEALHDLRVAIRRTRTVLEVGREVFGRFHADEVRRALTELQRATGALRDEEVLLEIIASLHLHKADVNAWVEVRRRHERRLRAQVRRIVRSGALDRARALLEALLTFRIKPSRERRLDKFARRAVERAQREVERRRRSAEDVAGLHALRVAYKRLRYTAETFSGALPDELGAQVVRTATWFQRRIGDVHDVDVVIAAVERARSLQASSQPPLLLALRHLRAERLSALRRGLEWNGVTQVSGTVSLRKTSIR
jgi:CHAD domain-containing protein